MPGRPFPTGLDNPASGPRLRLTGPRDLPECWRCTDTRRILRSYRLDDGTPILRVVRLCGECARSAALDPDPLTLPETA
jgi:hypothetical protein